MTQPFQVGAMIQGRYELSAMVGRGSMGVVYRAHDHALDREVAIKTIRLELLDSEADLEGYRARFIREARTAAKLNHPNVITIFDVGESEGNLYMAIEYLRGDTLERRLRSRRPLPLGSALDIAIQICSGLQDAHEHGVIHRDIKPANIMLVKDDRVKITDFGIAKMQSAATLTNEGMLVGTPAFMAPEQLRGGVAEARSDVFATGAVFYELLTGQRAFAAENVTAVILKVMSEEPRPVRRHNSELPAEIEAVVDRALQKDPARRFQTMTEFVAALEELRRLVGDGVDAADAASSHAKARHRNDEARAAATGPEIGISPAPEPPTDAAEDPAGVRKPVISPPAAARTGGAGARQAALPDEADPDSSPTQMLTSDPTPAAPAVAEVPRGPVAPAGKRAARPALPAAAAVAALALALGVAAVLRGRDEKPTVIAAPAASPTPVSVEDRRPIEPPIEPADAGTPAAATRSPAGNPRRAPAADRPAPSVSRQEAMPPIPGVTPTGTMATRPGPQAAGNPVASPTPASPDTVYEASELSVPVNLVKRGEFRPTRRQRTLPRGGLIIVSVLVDETGKARKTRILRSDLPEQNSAVARSAEDSEFTAGVKDGVRVRSWFTMTYSLRDE